MRVAGVSFGNIVAVYGPKKKMDKIDKKMSDKAMIKDVTSKYQYSMPTGLLAQAAQQGNSVKLYITGQERKFIEHGAEGWTKLNDVLENIQDYYDANKGSIAQVIGYLMKHK